MGAVLLNIFFAAIVVALMAKFVKRIAEREQRPAFPQNWVILRFTSDDDFDRADNILWNNPGLRYDLLSDNTIALPESTVPLLVEHGLAFFHLPSTMAVRSVYTDEYTTTA